MKDSRHDIQRLQREYLELGREIRRFEERRAKILPKLNRLANIELEKRLGKRLRA